MLLFLSSLYLLYTILVCLYHNLYSFCSVHNQPLAQVLTLLTLLIVSLQTAGRREQLVGSSIPPWPINDALLSGCHDYQTGQVLNTPININYTGQLLPFLNQYFRFFSLTWVFNKLMSNLDTSTFLIQTRQTSLQCILQFKWINQYLSFHVIFLHNTHDTKPTHDNDSQTVLYTNSIIHRQIQHWVCPRNLLSMNRTSFSYVLISTFFFLHIDFIITIYTFPLYTPHYFLQFHEHWFYYDEYVLSYFPHSKLSDLWVHWVTVVVCM